MKTLLSENNQFNGNLREFNAVLQFIPYFIDIEEDDYITYFPDRRFEYTPRFYEFIEALNKTGLVEDEQSMQTFLDEACFQIDACSRFSMWVREMNRVICRPELLQQSGLSFLRKAFFTLIHLEKQIPGSWGIDAEVGTWLKLLRRLQKIVDELQA